MTELVDLFWADRDIELNSSMYRIKIPGAELQRRGHAVVMRQLRTNVIPQSVAETVLLERIITPGIVTVLRHTGAKRVIGTFDDYYRLMVGTSASPYWDAFWPDFLRGLELCDEILVPSHRLATEFHGLVPVRFVPNFIDRALWDQPMRRRPQDDDRIVIGYGGSSGHTRTWKASRLGPILSKVQETFPEVIYYSCGGAAHVELAEAGVEWVGFPHTAFHKWPGLAKAFDIWLAPLTTAYDEYRSDLKLVEAGVCGKPWVASRRGPYLDWQGHGGYLVDRAIDWEAPLIELCNDELLRRSLGAAARKKAETYFMDKNVHTYEEILGL